MRNLSCNCSLPLFQEMPYIGLTANLSIPWLSGTSQLISLWPTSPWSEVPIHMEDLRKCKRKPEEDFYTYVQRFRRLVAKMKKMPDVKEIVMIHGRNLGDVSSLCCHSYLASHLKSCLRECMSIKDSWNPSKLKKYHLLSLLMQLQGLGATSNMRKKLIKISPTGETSRKVMAHITMTGPLGSRGRMKATLLMWLILNLGLRF